MFEKTLTIRQIIVGGLFICAGFVLALGLQATAWVNPTVPPPGGNVVAPINTSATTQTKSGSLNIGGKVTSASTLDTDPGNTLVTKDYVDAAAGGHVRGGQYGLCGVALDKDFRVTYSDPSPVWPMLACPGVGTVGASATCDAGFTAKQITYWQMNSASSGSIPTTEYSDLMTISKLNHFLDSDVYTAIHTCFKD